MKQKLYVQKFDKYGVKGIIVVCGMLFALAASTAFYHLIQAATTSDQHAVVVNNVRQNEDTKTVYQMDPIVVYAYRNR